MALLILVWLRFLPSAWMSITLLLLPWIRVAVLVELFGISEQLRLSLQIWVWPRFDELGQSLSKVNGYWVELEWSWNVVGQCWIMLGWLWIMLKLTLTTITKIILIMRSWPPLKKIQVDHLLQKWSWPGFYKNEVDQGFKKIKLTTALKIYSNKSNLSVDNYLNMSIMIIKKRKHKTQVDQGF